MTRKALAVKLLVWLSIIIVVIGVGFCLVYQARQPAEQHVESGGPKEDKAKQGGNRVAAVQQASTNPHDEATEYHYRYTPNWVFDWFAEWVRPITLLTLALVIGVGVTNYIYYGQLKKMRETVALVGEQRDMMKGQWDTMKEQATAAQIAANAAKESASVARQALLIAERPYLDVTRVKVSPIPFEVGKPIVYTARIENTGRTPAYDVWGGIYLTISESEIIDETGLDYPSFSHPPSKAPISAGQHQTRHRTTPNLRLTEFDVQRLGDGKLFFYVYGVEFYKDGFTTDIHRLGYCQQYNRLTKRMEVAPFHNSSD